ncbi:hypothetical protein MSP8887_04211 [Marinomonas spartinae]|uniref:Uncharacterized protein n=1 Tax=Marinomonas spartinae TaxID=1792290 RepID=A0A1A8T3L9_9GAMM|nr:hypothetical protein [Marinomonas spartinae]SBS26437.1 hypothetical protein MSP8886_00604 [Marinomonas spartinae]SBS40151.1 hypothetical protein MSP8887_04211 [Marinomonas spartinae]
MNDVNLVETMTAMLALDSAEWGVDEKYRNSLRHDCCDSLCALIIHPINFVNVINARL